MRVSTNGRLNKWESERNGGLSTTGEFEDVGVADERLVRRRLVPAARALSTSFQHQYRVEYQLSAPVPR
eukprot:2908138-Rhodomonas_salina.1